MTVLHYIFDVRKQKDIGLLNRNFDHDMNILIKVLFHEIPLIDFVASIKECFMRTPQNQQLFSAT